ncbi:MAG: 1-acyl-sn-glycerol-3-phosphate acyltransferase [Deltaproteobacteria bacterium]|nr:1-acyl-sn-glycerol-3-phosphate acyltransferase [Deltaproteobacteria bacterium]
MNRHRDDVELLLDHVRPVQARTRMTRLPFFKVVLITLEEAVRAVVGLARGRANLELGDELLRDWWPRVFRSGNASLRARGRAHFVPGQAYVVMSNHCSALDIPAIVGAVPASVRMVTKQELINVPLWGYAMHKCGFVPVDRKNRVKAIHQLDEAKALLRKGVCVWISPEGTRSRDGKLASFKKGGFHLAFDLGVPIVPAWVDGTEGIIAAARLNAREDGEVEVRFGAPIATAGLGKADMKPMMAEVRARILALSGRAAQVDAEVGAVADVVRPRVRKAS